MLAASMGHAEALEALLEGGAKLDTNDDDGFTPLMGVCSAPPEIYGGSDSFEERLVRCVEVIIRRGEGNVNARDCRRMTALM
jgi:hypothetical protein